MDKKESILIVDDDQNTRRSLALILGRKGYETETAETGREAIDKVQGRLFDVALLDINLPDVEGVELIAHFKEMRPDMALIMVTGYASVKTAVRALNEGASAYITKPLDMDEMLSNVRDMLEKQRLVQEKRRAKGALQESEARYRSLFDGVPVGLYRTTPGGQILDGNPALLQMLGYPDRGSLAAVSVVDLYVNPEDRRREQALL